MLPMPLHGVYPVFLGEGVFYRTCFEGVFEFGIDIVCDVVS